MEDVLVPNVMAIIEDNYKDALDYYFPDPLLPDFAERTLGQVLRKSFPYVAIGPGSNEVEESQDSARLTQPIVIPIQIGVVADTAEAVTVLIMKYVKVMHAVLLSASKSDYFLEDSVRTFGFSLELSHSYGALLSNNSTLLREAFMTLTLNFESR